MLPALAGPMAGVVGVPASQPRPSPPSLLPSGFPLSPPCPVSPSSYAPSSPTRPPSTCSTLFTNPSPSLSGPPLFNSFPPLHHFAPTLPSVPKDSKGSTLSRDTPRSPVVASSEAEPHLVGTGSSGFFLQSLPATPPSSPSTLSICPTYGTRDVTPPPSSSAVVKQDAPSANEKSIGKNVSHNSTSRSEVGFGGAEETSNAFDVLRNYEEDAPKSTG
ncbi:hypothetical protein Nepgr_002839 [Nepenthes gracilis]|uniref:Uncharacterized protein n=1 Tax=Nepenthes gracilis TaxID=150966 RepID=A0AAD3P8G3_NEPGR|nr:hypothetical protein Nepgr_002839 [Nepenthes gracilis]